MCVAPDSTSFHPSPLSQKPRLSSHIGSYQLNGTYISAVSISSLGLVIPAWLHKSSAQSLLACGFTSSRPGKLFASLRIAPAWIQAGLFDFLASFSFTITIAAAPSEDGHVSEYLIGSQSIGDSTTWSNVNSGCCKCA